MNTRRELPLPMPYDTIHSLFEQSIDLNNGTSPEKYEYYQRQFNDFANTVMQTPGAVAAFGTGYPFYAEDHIEQSIEPIEEMNRFLRQQKGLVPEKIGLWACIGCQGEKKLPDLKIFCKPCDATPVKPRDILKALPDLDYWVIAEEDTPEFREQLQNRLEAIGFYSSDQDIGASLHDLNDIFANELSQPKDSTSPVPDRQKRMPIDLHVVSRDYFTQVIGQIYEAIDNHSPGEILPVAPISPSSLHIKWELPDQPYDFMKDFLLSLTIHPQSNSDIFSIVDPVRAKAQERLTYEDILESVCQYDKEKRQLENPKLRYLLKQRFSDEP